MQEIPRLGVLRGRYVGKKRKKGKKAEPLTSALKKKNRAAVFVHTDLTITQLHHCTLKKKKVKSLMKTRVLSDCPVTGHFGSSHYFPAQGNPV